MLDVAGQDATEAFEDVGHSDEAREALDKLYVGELKRLVRENPQWLTKARNVNTWILLGWRPCSQGLFCPHWKCRQVRLGRHGYGPLRHCHGWRPSWLPWLPVLSEPTADSARGISHDVLLLTFLLIQPAQP